MIGNQPPCEHRREPAATICPFCLRNTWARAQLICTRTASARQARQAARKGEWQGMDGPEPEGWREERAALEYVLPPLEEVLRLTGGGKMAKPVVSHLYLWGYEPLRSSAVRGRAEPTEAARAFAAAHGWHAARSGAWALEWELPLPLSEALGELEPVLRGESAVLGWGGRMIRGSRPEHTVFGTSPDPPGTAPARTPRSAAALRERARRISAAVQSSVARQQQLRQEIRQARLERLRRLPPAEFDALNQAVTTALELGKAGQLAAGYALLRVRWEQTSAAAEQGVPWSSQLRWIYGLALENYVWRYGLSLP